MSHTFNQQNYSVGFLRGGQWVYAADWTGAVCIYRVDDGQVAIRLPSHGTRIFSIAVSPCGRYLASGFADNCVRLYHLESGRLLHEIREHEGWIWSVRFSPDSRVLFSASRDATVGCFDVAGGICVARRRVHDNEVNDVAVSPDGRLLATVSDDQTIRLLDTSLRCRTVIRGQNALVFRAIFIPPGSLLATCDHAGAVSIWDLDRVRAINVFYDYGRLNDLQMMGLAPSASGDILASANFDGFVIIRRIADGRLLARFNARESLFSVALCQERGLVAAGGEEGKVFLWQLGKPGSKRVLGARPPRKEGGLTVGAYNGFGRSSKDHTPLEDFHGTWPDAPELPLPPDRVRFSVTSKPAVAAGEAFTINVWAHLEHHLRTVLERANYLQGFDRVQVASKGPVLIKRGSNLTVRLRMEGMIVDDPEDFLVWDGEIANAAFLVQAPNDVAGESKVGRIGVYLDGLQIARLYFELWIAPHPLTQLRELPLREERNTHAFASYASADRDRVLGRIQGMQKVLPTLEVFLDVASLRSGVNWEQQLWYEIPAKDVFYLFWSAAASQSEWVRKEWQCALQTRGLDFIDPVPLESPEEVPPPIELASKHFNDWVLAHGRKA